MNVNKININQSEPTYSIASDAYDIIYEDSNVGEKLSELESLSQFVGKEKNITWFSAYIGINGIIYPSSTSLTSQPFMLYAGESITVATRNSNIGIICKARNSDAINVGDSLIILERTSSSESEFETHVYTAEEDTWIVICVLAADYSVSVDALDIDYKLSKRTPIVKEGPCDLFISDDNNNILVSFKDGHIKTKKFDSSQLSIETIDDKDCIDLDLCDSAGNILLELSNGHIKTKKFDSQSQAIKVTDAENFVDLDLCDSDGNTLLELSRGNIKTRKFDSEEVSKIIDAFPLYISAEQYNQIPTNKCNWDKVVNLAIGTIYKGNVTRIYDQSNFIARIALFGDLHVGYGYSFTNVPLGESDGYGWKNWEDYIELSLKRASNKTPDFGITLGDQLSSINNNLYNRGGVGLVERNDWYNRIRQFNYPLFNVFGNHDEAVPEFIHNGVIEIKNIRIIVFHMDIIYTTPLSTFNISDSDYAWLENAVKDSYNNGFITILASHYPIISDGTDESISQEYMGVLLVKNHGQDLLDLCQTYNVRLHIHGHEHSTGLPHIIMKNNGVNFDMTEVEIGLGARAYVILEIREDGFHFTEYPVTRDTGYVSENNISFNTYEVLDDSAGRTLFVPLYNQESGTIRSDDWTPHPGTEKE